MTRANHAILWSYPWYQERIRAKAKALGADGCTGVPEFFRDGCLEHDIAYRTHRDLLNNPITKAEADFRLKWYIQMHSIFVRFSPMAWWRWRAVKHFADKAWDK